MPSIEWFPFSFIFLFRARGADLLETKLWLACRSNLAFHIFLIRVFFFKFPLTIVPLPVPSQLWNDGREKAFDSVSRAQVCLKFYWLLLDFLGFHWFFFYGIILGFTEFQHVVFLLAITGFFNWILPSYTRYYRVLLGFTKFYRVWWGFIGFWLGHTGFYRVLTWLFEVEQGYTRFSWVLPGFTEFDEVCFGVTGVRWRFIRSYWVLPGWNMVFGCGPIRAAEARPTSKTRSSTVPINGTWTRNGPRVWTNGLCDESSDQSERRWWNRWLDGVDWWRASVLLLSSKRDDRRLWRFFGRFVIAFRFVLSFFCCCCCCCCCCRPPVSFADKRFASIRRPRPIDLAEGRRAAKWRSESTKPSHKDTKQSQEKAKKKKQMKKSWWLVGTVRRPLCVAERPWNGGAPNESKPPAHRSVTVRQNGRHCTVLCVRVCVCVCVAPRLRRLMVAGHAN